MQAWHKFAKAMVFSAWITLFAYSTVLIHVRHMFCSAQFLLSETFVGVGKHRIMCMRALGYVALYR